NPLGTTFGSVYRPREAGGGVTGGSLAYGGGILRIIAGTLQGDGAIRANGGNVNDRSAAGGSIWITTTDFNGNGTIDANGGDSSSNYTGMGGGGAISIEYTGNSTGTILTRLTARTAIPTGNNRTGGETLVVDGHIAVCRRRTLHVHRARATGAVVARWNRCARSQSAAQA